MKRAKAKTMAKIRMEQIAPIGVFTVVSPRMFSVGTGAPNISSYFRNFGIQNVNFFSLLIICKSHLILLIYTPKQFMR